MADTAEHGLNYQQGIETFIPYRVNASVVAATAWNSGGMVVQPSLKMPYSSRT
jgi:hypothetical protein